MKILLAEDDQSISVISKLSLEKIGKHTVVVAKDGIEALSHALQDSFDLILLDSMMPGKDGLRVCLELKQTHQIETPIIFMSAKSQDSDIREGLSAGAIGYIQKPFDPKNLCGQIDKILQNTMVKI